MGFIRENILKIIFFIIFFVILIVIFSLFFGKSSSVKVNSYLDMESYLLSAGKKYYSDNKKSLPNNENEMNKVNLDTLVNEKYIKELTAFEDEKVTCTGYVEVTTLNKGYKYVPYLKCGKYYETQTFASYIINNEKLVNSEDGLYKLGNTYVYRGENPHNYVLLGDKKYRIIDITGDEARLISVKKLSMSLIWDNRYNVSIDRYYGINDYSRSRLKDLFEEAYNYNVDDYTLFNDVEKDKMVLHDVCVGKRYSNYNAIDSSNECKTKESNQIISLITVSDYARSSADTNCKNIYSKACVNYNYMSQLNSSFETITAAADNTYQVFKIVDGVATLVKASNSFTANIVIHLDKSSLYSSGDGTEATPYIVR